MVEGWGEVAQAAWVEVDHCSWLEPHRPQVEEGVDRGLTPADFEVAVLGGGVARSPNTSNRLAAPHPLAYIDQQFRVVGVKGTQAVTVIDDDRSSVIPHCGTV